MTLTTDVPVATDGTSKPEKLLYAVSLPPVHGQIEHINYPGVPISSYSQLDVVAQKVSDVHDNSHGAGKESLRWEDLPFAHQCAEKPSASEGLSLPLFLPVPVGAIFNDRYGCGEETAANSNKV